MDGMVAQSFYAEEKGNCSFELRCQEQYLEVEEGLLVYREVGFIWRRGEKVDLEGVRLLRSFDFRQKFCVFIGFVGQEESISLSLN